METKKTSKTLTECSLGRGNLNEKSASDHLREVEFDGELGNRRITESSVDGGIAGNDQIKKETLGSNASEVKDNNVPVWEGDSESKTKNRFGIEDVKVEESMERGNDVLLCPEPTAIKVSGKGINLFIEVFGPLDGMSEGNDYASDNKGERVVGGGDPDKECLEKEDGVLSLCDNRESEKSGVESGVREQDHTFNVDDLVWVKTRSGLWWPGIVSKSSDAASDAKKTDKTASFRVKYFGIANWLWCPNSELKPFIEYYDQMSRQTKSRNFLSSVEKAVCEIGQRVKLNMTCRCFPKEVECKESNSESVYDKHKADTLSLSQFEPAGFVAHIRDLARSVHTPGKIKLTVTKNCLSAFYCSTGHRELPLLRLRSSSETEDVWDRPTPEVLDEDHKDISRQCKDSVKTSDDSPYALRRKRRSCTVDTDQVCDGKVTSPRERKKSKYLSYPYVDIKDKRNAKSTEDKEKENEHLADPSTSSKKSISRGRCKGMTSQKSGSWKSSKGCYIDSKAVDINANSADLLAELRSTACGCFQIGRSKHAGSLTGFFSGFRNFAFIDADKASKVYGDQQEPNGEECIVQNMSEAEVLEEGIKEGEASRKQRIHCESVKKAVDKSVDGKISETKDPEEKGSGRRKRTKKNKEHIISASPQATGNLVGTYRKDNLISSCTISLQQTCSDVPKDETAPEKRDGHSKQSAGSCAGVGTDKNDNPQSSSVISFQQTGSDMPKSGTVPEKSEGRVEQSTGICAGTVPEKSKGRAEQSTGICAGMGKKDNPNSSCMISFQQSTSDVPKSGASLEKTGGSDPVLSQINAVVQLPDLNGKHPIESVCQIPSGRPSADLGKPFTNFSRSHQSESVEQIRSEGRPPADSSRPVTNLGMQGLVIKNVSGIQQAALALFPSLQDTSIPILQNIRQSNNPVNSTQLCQSAEFAAKGPERNVSTNARIISFAQPSLQMGAFPTVGKPEQTERKRKQKAQQAPSAIPDLNGNVLDCNSQGRTIPEGIVVSPDGLPPQKKGKTKSSTAESGSKGKVKSNEDPGGSLLLKFIEGSTLPSKEILVSKFSRFGLLKVSEIQMIDDSSVQIAYERSSDAKFAFRSLEKSSPFGEVLADFKLHCTDAASKPTPKKRKFLMPQPILPMEVRKNLPKPVEEAQNLHKPVEEAPDLAVMKQNAEMMKLTLERAGNTISPEMRVKLESEIKGFLDKIKTLGSSSSSS